MAKVSVIIAAHNKEKEIAACVESVLAQTLEDVEAVVVNDASTDRTLEILKKLQALDSRVKIVDETENQGTLRTRSNGFKASTGEYIMYLDGDDRYAPDACEKAYNAIVKKNVDVVQFGTEVMTDDPERYRGVIESMENGIFSAIPHRVVTAGEGGLMGAESVSETISLTMWNKIYKREIVEKTEAEIPDTYMVLAEDWMFSFVALGHCHSYHYIKDRLYRYNYGEGISANGNMPESKMKALAKNYYAYTFLHEWTKKHNAEKQCKKRLEGLRQNWLDGLAWNFLMECPKEKRGFFLQEIEKYCPLEDFIGYVAYATHGRQLYTEDLIADAFRDLPIVQTPQKKVRTIGTFYFRMYNGGVENVMSRLMDIWVKSGYNVVLFTDEEPNTKDYHINPAVKRVVMPKIEKQDFESYHKRVAAWNQAIKKYEIDTVVYHAWLNPIFVGDALSIKSSGSGLVVHTHSVFCADMDALVSHYAYTNLVLNKCYQLADMVVTLSEMDRLWWRSCGLRSVYAINPIKVDFSIEPSKLDGHNILFVGRIEPKKNVPEALRTMQYVHKQVPDAVLTIVGSAESKESWNRLVEYIKENEMEDYVRLAGFHSDVTPFYQNSDVMLCTSQLEGQSLVISESKICGLPLVTYELPFADFVREEKGMFVVPQLDAKGAAECIVRLLQDEDLRKRMGREARESAKETFSIDWCAFWDDVLEQSMQPVENKEPLYKRPIIETAVGLMLDYTSRGVRTRGFGQSADAGELLNYQLQCNALDATIKEIRSSTSYRIGRAITAIPGVFVNLFRRLFGKKKKEEQ